MGEITVLLALVVLFTLVFEYINGFHDTANAIATVVATRVLTPRTAILMAAGLNLLGALVSVGVAKTISSGLVETVGAPQVVILSAVIGAIIWNLITWWFGIPSSSSHALIGGLIGAAFVFAGPDVVIWKGVRDKFLIPIVASPLTGFALGFLIMTIIYKTLARQHPANVNKVFRVMQVASAALTSFSHGSNDAQKSMGIITLALVSQGLLTKADGIPLWVKLVCAITMAAGTAGGGWRIMKTMGHKIIRLEPVHGFAAETAASITILLADRFGAPISTTQAISGGIFGVGASKRLSAVRWGVAQRMVMAWIVTLPAAGGMAAVTYLLFKAAGLK